MATKLVRSLMFLSFVLLRSFETETYASENQNPGETNTLGQMTRRSVISHSVEGPVLGYVFDHARGALRAIRGIPGAATLGEPLRLGASLSRAWTSPRQDYAFIERQTSQGALLLRLEQGSYSLQTIPLALDRTDEVIFSPTGVSAAFVHGVGQRLRIVKNLPQSPLAASPLDVSSLSPEITAIAVSDDGSAVLLGTSDNGRGLLHLLTLEGGIRLVSHLGQISAVSFLRDSFDALIADEQANEVSLIRDVKGAASRSILAGENDGISGPVAVDASFDKQRVFVVNSRSSTVAAMNINGGNLTLLHSGDKVTGLHRLGNGPVFRVTELSEKPLLLLDGGTAAARVVFVPALRDTLTWPRLPDRLQRGESRRIRIPERRRQE